MHRAFILWARSEFTRDSLEVILMINIIVWSYLQSLEYGSYAEEWRRRNALKMWTGWSTFPIVFVKGTLIGGFSDMRALIDAGELEGLLTSD